MINRSILQVLFDFRSSFTAYWAIWFQIQRHGARYPTSGASKNIRAAVDKLLSATEYRDLRLFFLRDYTYDLGVADQIPLGASQYVSESVLFHFLTFRRSFDAGVETFKRYKSLVSKDNIPFVRSSSGQRVVDAAANWTSGSP